jgi:DNA-binding NtrC family response regulator
LQAVGKNAVATVLIVEDEAPLLILAESVLQNAGYETLTAGSLTEAQAVIQSKKKIDAVFTDIILPEDREGGLHVGQVVRQTARDTPVLYTTAGQVTDGMKALFVWPYAFLPKPYTDHQLLAALAGLLKRS